MIDFVGETFGLKLTDKMRQLVSKLMRFNFINRPLYDVRSHPKLSYALRNAEVSFEKYFVKIQDFDQYFM